MERDFRVGDQVVRPRVRQIEGPEGPTVIQVRSMEVLADLAQHAGEVRTRQELLEAVWGDAFVTEEVLSHSIWELRRALGDNARKPHIIQTVPRKGYCLIAPVSWLEVDPGKTPRYRLLDKLGSGGMGVVWKAEDTLLHRTVALKFLPDEWSREAKAKKRFLREARIAASLDHPNICTLHELGETEDGRLHLVLAYVPGETLRTRLEKGALHWQEAVRIGIAMARGLVAAHVQGIVHRDIKPANIMLDGDEVKILDFGIARFADDTETTLATSSPGTPAYKSPEQARGHDVDPRSDLWALGVVLYEMLAGSPPFRGGYADAVVHAILNEEPKPLSALSLNISSALEAVVQRLLAKNPNGRYSCVEEVLRDLEGLLAEPPPTVGRTALVDTAQQDRSRLATSLQTRGLSRTLVGAIVLAAALLFLGFAISNWRGKAPEPVRVVVPRPEVLSNEEAGSLDLIASNVLVATLNGLSKLEGVSPLGPPMKDGPETPSDIARVAGADEVLLSTVEAEGKFVRVVLQRVRGEDGRVVWSKRFGASSRLGDARLLAAQVRARLEEAYPANPRRPGVSTLGVRDEDYELYLEIQRRHDRGQLVADRDLEALDNILSNSQRFYDAWLLWADLALIQMRDERHLDLLQEVMEKIDRAEELLPESPKARVMRFRAQITAGRFDDAEQILQKLQEQRGDELFLLQLRAELLQARGDAEGARALMKEAVELRPTWVNLMEMVDMEYRAGQALEARAYLQQLLDMVPGNRLALSKLAQLELVYGDLTASEGLYRRLITWEPRFRTYWTNLGITQFLQGDFANASASYQQALELAPGHPLVLLNLAGAEFARGHTEVAREYCRQVVESFEDTEKKGALDPVNSLMKAHCQARTGAPQAAVTTAQELLRSHAENAEVVYQAAVVYALAGERFSALTNAKRARELGVEARWFRVPEFAPLAEEPAFRSLQE